MMEKLIELLEKIIPNVDFGNSTSLITDGELDSIEIVSIVEMLEAEYNIQIGWDDIEPDNFESVKAIYAMVQKYLK